MNSTQWIVCYWALGVFCGIGCVMEAKRKGRSEAWFFAGLLFNVLGLLLAVVASDLEEEERSREKLQELEEAFRHLQRRFFCDATVTEMSKEKLSICSRCLAFQEDEGYCREFGRSVWQFRIAKCRYFDEPAGLGRQNQDAADG